MKVPLFSSPQLGSALSVLTIARANRRRVHDCLPASLRERRRGRRLINGLALRAAKFLEAVGQGLLTAATFTRSRPAIESLCYYRARESSDKPRLNAFCLVAPSVRFKAWAILAARVFLLAAAFNLRTSNGVHARRFDLLAIYFTPARINECSKPGELTSSGQ
jgi:hypothetical protein